MKKEKIKTYSSSYYLYNIQDEANFTTRYIIRMKEEIDGDALKKAFETTMERYPYLKLRLVRGVFHDHFEYNDLPLVVLHTNRAVTFGPQTNWHLLVLTYKRTSIYINNFHGILDGRGREPLMRTFMYYYCTFRYGETVEMDNVNLVGSPVDPLEYEDPYSKAIASRQALKTVPEPGNPMVLKNMGKVQLSSPHIQCLCIDEQQFMSWCKQFDATPNVAVATLMSRAIRKIHPDSGKNIVANVTCDPRAAMNAPKTHWPVAVSVPLNFTDDIAQLDLNAQCTAMRGQLVLKSDPDELINSVNMMYKSRLFSASMPNFLKKILFKKLQDVAFDAMTFLVSYSGKTSYGSCDKHIRGCFAEPNCGLYFQIEIMTADGHFFLDISQRWKEDIYVRGFMEELEAIGIQPELIYDYDQRFPIMNE